MKWIAAVIAAATLACSASAQEAAPDPIIAQYRVYRAALDAGDLTQAETAAQAALNASLARDGDEGRTGVLAMNLAQVRLDQNRPADAYEPAARAHAISQAQGAAANIDPLMVRLVLGQADLARAGANADDFLLAALNEANARSDLAAQAYPASVALGRWAFANEEYATARAAWASAGCHAAGAMFDVEFTSARALTFEGAALIAARELSTAKPLLAEARDILRSYAAQGSDERELTIGQAAYAEAMAWDMVRYALAPDESEPAPLSFATRIPDPRFPNSRTVSSGGGAAELCRLQVRAYPLPRYPVRARNDLLVGAVVLRVIIDPQGRAFSREVAAAVPGEPFTAAVGAVVYDWEFNRHPDSAPGCEMAQTAFLPVTFRF